MTTVWQSSRQYSGIHPIQVVATLKKKIPIFSFFPNVWKEEHIQMIIKRKRHKNDEFERLLTNLVSNKIF